MAAKNVITIVQPNLMRALNLGAFTMVTQVAPSTTTVSPSAAAVAATTVLKPSVARFGIDRLRWLDPQLAAAVAAIPFAMNGMPRRELRVPICPAPTVSEQTFLEEAADPSQKLYLPHYKLESERVSGREQFRAQFAARENGWALMLYFKKYPDEKLGLASRTARELGHTTAVLLRYVLEGLQKELLFQEVTTEGNLLKASLQVNNLPERDELFRALNGSEYKTMLLVRRTAEVALPVPPLVNSFGGATGSTALRPGWYFDFEVGGESAAGDIWFEAINATQRRLVPRGRAQLAWLGRVNFDVLDLPQLKNCKYTAEPLDGSLNDLPGALLLATSRHEGVYHPQHFGVWYDAVRGQWCVFNQNRGALAEKISFNLARPAASVFLHGASVVNTSGHVTQLDHPLTNNNPGAIVVATPNYERTYNDHPIGVWYNNAAKRWTIYNQDLVPMPNGAWFNVEAVAPSDKAFVHRAAADNLSGHITRLNHPLTNNNPNALLTVTANFPDGSGRYTTNPFGVWYDGARWTIFNQNGVALEAGLAFNVIVRQPGPDAFVHSAKVENTAGNCSYFTLPNKARNQLQPGDVFAVRTNGGHYAKVKVLESADSLRLQWVTYPAAGAQDPLYRATTRVLDEVIPLSLERGLHPYAYEGMGGSPAAAQGKSFIRHPVKWNGRDHNYYQEYTRREVFHYLPDAFKLARRPQSPRVPLMFLQMDGAENPSVRLDYTAFRYDDDERLEDAARKLCAKPNCLPAGVEPVFVPLAVETGRATLQLGLPRASAFQPRPGASVSTQLGLKDVLTDLSWEDFQSLWEALADTTGAAVLFQGQVEIKLPEVTEQVPFIARLNDLVGDHFVIQIAAGQIAAGQGDGQLMVTLRNDIESPLTINLTPIKLTCNNVVVPFTLQSVSATTSAGAATAWPITLQPGETAQLSLTTATALPDGGVLDVICDHEAFAVTPDWERITECISPGLKPESKRAITVRAFRELFSDALTELVVEFERGTPITLTPDKREAVAEVRFPLADVLARKDSAERFRFRVVTPRKHGEWQSAAADFTINSEMLP
ncbi:MAG: hypothetical protein ABI977_07855 [Acidobacteriota bacterium]